MKKEFDPEDVKDLDFHVRVHLPKDKYFQRLSKYVYKTYPFRVKADNIKELRTRKRYLSKCIAFINLRQWGINQLITLQGKALRRQIKAMEE